MKFLKKSLASIICSMFVLLGTSQIGVFADLEDITKLGGSYIELRTATRNYREQNTDDKTVYECHHLISREALNQWAYRVYERHGINGYNRFLNDEDQNWAPSIIMEKADHEKTRSYYNKKARTYKQNQNAGIYIDYQAEELIDKGNIIGLLKVEDAFIRVNFGHKYDRALSEMWSYVRSLQFRHQGTRLVMNNPYSSGLYMRYAFGK